MERITRSFRLVGVSYRLLMQDKELMVLPLLSGSIMLVIVVSFFVGFGFLSGGVTTGPETYVPLLLMYVVTYTVGLFFQAAIIAGATERMRGGDPTLGSALAAAQRRLGPIVMWALVAATVGMLLRAIQDRVGFVGKIIVGIVGATWSLATFFIVPVLVLEEKSIQDSFSQSVSVFKKTWGETVTGGASLGLAGFFAWMALAVVVGLLAAIAAPLAIVLLVAGSVFLGIFFSALQGVYVASLYRYATEGQAPSGFDSALLDRAFVPKR